MVIVVPWEKKPISAGGMPLAMNLATPVKNAVRGVLRRACDFFDEEIAACAIEQHQIGVGAPNIHAEPVARTHGPACPGCGAARA